MNVASIRTPDERFEGLPDFSFEPHYAEVAADGAALRMHYLDEGPAGARPIVCLHGEPTWCYLYRKMIPHFSAAGYRTIAPDLIGFGRSDKPLQPDDYTYARHVAWVRSLLDRLALRDAILVGQDWGGLIGLRLLAESPDDFAAAVLANTGLPTGDGRWSEAFERWRDSSQRMREFLAGVVLARTCTPPLSADEGAIRNEINRFFARPDATNRRTEPLPAPPGDPIGSTDR